ncbi:beta-lactamase family protein [Burkholderiaceae bacterium FT117]|uniref:serine hydrolase domain-containing protein n=1 Tax=Zeimonas sediminis TaxID=2944268 RepID=UPI002342FA21|nr:serine hydrolase domain-containing protein [Zeimonas sediminis]MCM5571446.1 beta-lactamase family protein [Zeimonas sediminis]
MNTANRHRQGTALLDRFLDWQIAARHYPGAVVHVERDGEVLARRAAGVLDPETGTPMGEDAVFRIASMTKPVVSALALMLVEQGRLALDEPVSRWLPELAGLKLASGKAPARQPTVRDLMRHTSGFAYVGEIRDPALRGLATQVDLDGRLPTLSPDQVLATLAALPLACEPGTQFLYGFSTDVLGLVVERITGVRLGDALREALFEPLGMNDTGFAVPDAAAGRFARAHAEDRLWHGFSDKYALAQQMGVPMHSGGGGLVSTIDDYARFARMLLAGGQAGGRRFLSEDSLRQMFANQLDPMNPGPVGYTGPGFGFGLGLAVRLQWGASATPSTAGELTWFGICGTVVWLHPRERWFALQFGANMRSRMLSRMEFRRTAQFLLDES